jgi:hypothetical protein
MKISKRNFLIAIPLAVISFEIYFGVMAGYLSALFLAGKKTGEQGKIKSLAFDLGRYRVHLHHWLLCISLIPFAIHYNLSFLSDQFAIGIMGGLAYQGIACYNDWHKVFFKKK